MQIDQTKFLYVKERLDFYRLPVSFPVEATELLHKLIGLLDENANNKIYEKENIRYQQLLQQLNQPCCSSTSTSWTALLDEALRLQLSKHVRQNNQLHQQIMILKEEISVLNHQSDKEKSGLVTRYHRNSHDKEKSLVEEFSSYQYKQAMSELQDAKYKYNQLLEMVFSDDNKDKQYIKKLLKNKPFDLSPQSHTNIHSSLNNNKKQGQSGNSTKNNGIIDSDHEPQTLLSSSGMEIQMLKQKLANRQGEILRLKSKLQFDGLNLNRIINDFSKHKTKQQQAKKNERIVFLQQQNHLLTQKMDKIKKLGGDKLVVKELNCKLNETIDGFKNRIKQSQLKDKEGKYDRNQEKKENKRKLNQTMDKLNSVMKEKTKDKIKINQNNDMLKSKAQEMDNLRQQLQKANGERDRSQGLLKELRQKLQETDKQLQDLKLMQYYQQSKKKQEQINQNQQLLEYNEKLRSTISHLQNLIQDKLSPLQSINPTVQSNSVIGKDGSIINAKNSINESTNLGIEQSLILQLQNNLLLKQSQLRKKQAQIVKLNAIVSQYQRQSNLIREQLSTLKRQTLTLKSQLSGRVVLEQNIRQLQSNLSQLQEQLATYKEKIQRSDQLLNLQRSKCQKLQLQAENSEKINQEFNLLKDHCVKLTKEHKSNALSLQLRIKELEEVINSKSLRLNENEVVIAQLESQVVSCSETIRALNRELGQADEHLHKLRLERPGLERKISELVAQLGSVKEKEKVSWQMKETQLQTQIQQLNREIRKHKIESEDYQQQVQQLKGQSIELRQKLNEVEILQEEHKQEIQTQSHRLQLYEMEIRQLKTVIPKGQF